jgi:hypothetical protein
MGSDSPKVGRPTKYKEEYCDHIVEFMSDGSSKVQFCADIGISYDAFLRWQNENPRFHESVKRAELMCQSWWEKKSKSAIFGGVEGFNATGYIFNMKNRFPEFYKDKQEIDMNAKVSSADDWSNDDDS